MAYGLTSTGFVPKPYEQVLADVQADLRSRFGESIDLSASSVFGQLAGIIAERVSEVWDAAQGVYNAFVPDASTGSALDALAAVTGTLRLAATHSTVTLTATGTPGTSLSAGRQASVATTLERFTTLALAVIVAADAWANSTAYVVGDRVTNASRVYQCTTAGTSAGSGGPTTTSTAITDGTVTWAYVGEGTGVTDIDAESANTGPVVGAARTIATIETPVSGWSTVVNLADAVLGRAVESDADLRIRREADLQATGGGAVEQIRESLTAVTGVTEVTVYENTTDATVDSIPPHAVEALVLGGASADIAAALFATVAAGIGTYGGTTETVTDSMGIDHDVSFSRPTAVPIYVALTLTYDASLYPSDGDAQVKQAIVDYGDTFRTGWDVRSSALLARVFAVPGVLDVTVCNIGTAPAPSGSTTITTTARELATFDTSRVTVSSSSATP